MKKTTWIGVRSVARFSRVMERSGYYPYHDTTSGAYVLNLINHYPFAPAAVVAAALDKARHSGLPDDLLTAVDDLDLRCATEIG